VRLVEHRPQGKAGQISRPPHSVLRAFEDAISPQQALIQMASCAGGFLPARNCSVNHKVRQGVWTRPGDQVIPPWHKSCSC
jgi:hypothetical protein